MILLDVRVSSVHDLTDVIDQFDDQLRHKVARCGFSGEEVHARNIRRAVVFDDSEVFVDHAQHMQELAFVSCMRLI